MENDIQTPVVEGVVLPPATEPTPVVVEPVTPVQTPAQPAQPQISAEEAAKIVQAEQQRITEACINEINLVLEKYKCRLAFAPIQIRVVPDVLTNDQV